MYKTITILPQEILIIIASFVTSDSDRYQCLFVSHTWLKAFRPALYHHICIKNRKQFQKFQKYIQKYNKYVKQLYFQDNVGISRDELDQLPNLLPNIERLYFHPRIWKYQRKKTQLQWDRLIELPPLSQDPFHLLGFHGNQLSSLVITASLLNDYPIHTILKQTPHLYSLHVIGRDKNSMNPALLQRYAFTLTDIHEIHHALPELKDITLSQVLFRPLTEHEHTFHSYPLVEHFTIEQGSLADACWLSFIASAYPNIITLILDASYHPLYKQRMRQTDYDIVKKGIIKIGKDYRQLKHIRVGDVGGVVRAADRLFFDTLYENGMTLTNIDCTVTSNTSSKESFDSMMRCTNQHLNTLRVQLWRDIQSIENIVSPLSQCHQLTELELICGKFAYSWKYACEIDVILDFCPRLHTLKLTTARMTKRNTSKTPSLLQKLILKKVHFSTDAFHIVADRCLNLKELVLDHCVKEKDALNHEILISLPNTRLEKLVIDHISLRPSPFFEKCSMDAAMLAVDLYDQQDRQKARHIYHPTFIPTTRYYHLYSEPRNTKHIRRLRRLTAEEALETRLQKINWDLLEEQVVRGTYRQKQFWKSDIPYGYVHIQCRAIEKLLFNKVIYT